MKYPGYAKWRDKKIWAVGYMRDYLEGSDEVRQVVIRLHPETLLVVCESELSDWKEEEFVHKTNALDRLNDIRNLVTVVKGVPHTVADHSAVLHEIENICNVGLGLTPEKTA